MPRRTLSERVAYWEARRAAEADERTDLNVEHWEREAEGPPRVRPYVLSGADCIALGHQPGECWFHPHGKKIE